MGRRPGPADERRVAILVAAETVFLARGYSGASIRAIATQAGVSSALLYWFFPSKADLFAAVLLTHLDTPVSLALPPALWDAPPTVVLPRLAEGFLAVLHEGGQVRLMRLVLRDSDRAPDLTAAISAALLDRVLGPLSAYFARQMDLGTIRRADPDFVVQTLIGSLIGLLLRREILQEPHSRTWDVPTYLATTLDLFLHGAAAHPGSPPRPVPPPVAPALRAAQHIPVED
ncbi:MAG: TetR/AcrR family transcriptional regulator [Chloroflexota bacterium]|nr:TetR/AcrR family transcriptional regulator [Chloroflexota bacterium]